MLQRAARNAYSWWWASHVRTKQSKWLEDNLQDMEEKVEYILGIIDEDGDTFAQRAEMYYRKRPEIVNFVEDSFRGYRALAERYDHLSRELQSANRTIATIFPESVQLNMEETDDFDKGNLPSTILHSEEFSKNPENPPALPQLAIPKFPSFARKEPKKPSRLMSKKGLIKIGTKDATVAVTRSGLERSEAFQRIDELQKGILALQTEKEFVRSSYEKGIERYGEIEKQITEMQEEVSNLQDEFGIGTVIEDDEARSIMTATALKSCQETLTRLLQKQEQSAEDAREELQRIQEAQEKMVSLKQKHSHGQKEEQEQVDVHDKESLGKKVMEELRLSLGTTLTTSELADKVDELVDKIIKLDTAVSSHGAYVQRLRLETKEFNAHLKCLEVKKETSSAGTNNMSKKITELEEELQRIQSLNQDMKEQNYHLQTGFAEASCSIHDLYEKLQNVKPDEETDMVAPSVQATSVPDLHVNNIWDIKKQCQMSHVEELNDHTKVTSGIHVANQLKDPKLTATHFSQQPEVPEPQITLHVEDEMVPKKAKKDGNVGHSDTVLADPTSNHISSPNRSQLEFTSGDLSTASEERCIEDRDQIGPASGSGISHCLEYQQEANELSPCIRSFNERYSDHHLFLSGRQDSTDIIRAADPEEGFKEREDGLALEYHFQLQNEARKQDSTGIVPSQQSSNCLSSNESSGKSDQESADYPNQANHKSQQIKSETQSDLNGSLGKRFKEHAVEVNTENSFSSNTNVQHVNGGQVVSYEGREDKKSKVIVQNSITLAEDHHPKSVVGEDESMEEKNGIHFLPCLVEDNGSLGKNNPHAELNQQENLAQGMAVIDGFPTVLTSEKMEKDMKKHSLLKHETDEEQKVQNGLQNTETNFTTELDQNVIEEDKSPNWKELLLSGLDDRQRMLLEEYTSILRNYKEARKKLSEVEKKNRASAFRYCIQIKVLESSNALKDAKIQSLQKKLNLLQHSPNRTAESTTTTTTTETTNNDGPNDQSSKIHQKVPADSPHEETNEAEHVKEETSQQQIKISHVETDGSTNVIEEKIRADIDDLLEENIEFWMKFSTSLQQIQKFRTVVQDLQAEIAKVKAKKEQDTTDHQSVISDIRPMYRHLSEIQTELVLWLDQNDVLKDDLYNRLSSMSSIEEEIRRLSSDNSTVEASGGISDYQAAKFQGEILNMKHENNRLADELQSGIERVRNLRIEIERTLVTLDKQFGISNQRQQNRYTAVRSRIPLRSFLFGAKLKKQKQKHSFFACMNPVLQKKYSDNSALPP